MGIKVYSDKNLSSGAILEGFLDKTLKILQNRPIKIYTFLEFFNIKRTVILEFSLG